jgi:hypothetical protein
MDGVCGAFCRRIVYSNQMSQYHADFSFPRIISVDKDLPTGFPTGLMTTGYVIKISPSKTKGKTKLEGKRDEAACCR